MIVGGGCVVTVATIQDALGMMTAVKDIRYGYYHWRCILAP